MAQGYANQLDQYKIIKQLSRTAIKAVHKGTGKIVVIKVIANSEQDQMSEKWISEITLMSHF